jgi:hypothetical protein
MTKSLKEFYSLISVNYPKPKYPQDLIDGQVMPALRRSFDRARRENVVLAKATITGTFDMVIGPVLPDMRHVNGEICDIQWDDTATCQWCDADVALYVDHYVHQYGWYVAVEVDEEEKEEVSPNALH